MKTKTNSSNKDNQQEQGGQKKKKSAPTKESSKQKTVQEQVPTKTLKFRVEQEDQQMQMTQQNLTRRFKINMRQISQSYKNKLSIRFQEIDRLFVCRKTKEQRANMGIEFEGIKLIDIYTKSNQNKVVQKYGKSLIMGLVFNIENQPTIKRKVRINHDYKIPEQSPEEEQEEEKLLDEQKLFQSLHESLMELQKKYNKTVEQVSELFLRVCGDLEMVEKALQGQEVVEWTYLEDLALTKPFESTEYQWLLKCKGQKEIDKRRKFLLTADADTGDKDKEMIDETGAHDVDEDEAINDEAVNYI